ncbi:MAG: class I SAM-dependent methyltransferase [Anaerolineae bacterium]|nr:class I SAM-dependent methyltransferase [Anaerolineae bacterium]
MSLRFHEIIEEGIRIINPFTAEKLARVGEIVQPAATTNILDLCCGEGEMLSQWAKTYGLHGTGIDLSHVFSASARKRAAELGVSDQITIIQGDAAQYRDLLPDPDQSFDIVSCIGATWIGDGLVGTLELMRPALKESPNSLILIGEPFWNMEPTADVLKAVNFPPELYLTLPATLQRIRDAGYNLLSMVMADKNSWDHYKTAGWINGFRWLAANPTAPDAAELRDWLETDQMRYMTIDRDYFGWGVFILSPTD